ncbi:DUF2249 domain-containing protein [Nocardioides taihuensis]|uniref:DUF2249 domain-containing protein n=1 Tax=Nocardioides taihuensis TaxID=1835606 RepID=A0ABW0BR51_9ACTN
MTDVVIAPNEADARAAEAVEQHHAQMSGTLSAQVEALVSAVARGDAAGSEQARGLLLTWCRDELVPHALAEEDAMYPPARATLDGRLLVDGMLAEHRVITGLVEQLSDDATRGARAVAVAAALRAVFEVHLAKENDLVLPLLLSTPGVSVADLLGGMHELLGGHDREAHADDADAAATAAAAEGTGCGSGHACSCGEQDAEGYPELDARGIPHAIRHATIIGALDTVRPGSGLVLLAPHDPVPLLAQVGERWPDRFRVDYLERGPQVWRLVLVRGEV